VRTLGSCLLVQVVLFVVVVYLWRTHKDTCFDIGMGFCRALCILLVVLSYSIFPVVRQLVFLWSLGEELAFGQESQGRSDNCYPCM
jgi:hypothetical protein